MKEVIINTVYLKLQLLPATCQYSGDYINIAAARRTRWLYDINISQGSLAALLRCGGTFND